jgi:hypothetical protein
MFCQLLLMTMMVHSLGFDVANPLGHEPGMENLHSQIVYATEIFHTKLTYSKGFKLFVG